MVSNTQTGLNAFNIETLLNIHGQFTSSNQTSTSTTALTASASTVTAGSSITFTATVTGASGSTGTPTGTVTFLDETTTLGTGTLASGVATYSTSSLSVGSHSVTAIYDGDTDFGGSTSTAVTVTVSGGQSPITGDFAIALSHASGSIAQGSTANTTVSITPTGGFNQQGQLCLLRLAKERHLQLQSRDRAPHWNQCRNDKAHHQNRRFHGRADSPCAAQPKLRYRRISLAGIYLRRRVVRFDASTSPQEQGPVVCTTRSGAGDPSYFRRCWLWRVGADEPSRNISGHYQRYCWNRHTYYQLCTYGSMNRAATLKEMERRIVHENSSGTDCGRTSSGLQKFYHGLIASACQARRSARGAYLQEQ